MISPSRPSERSSPAAHMALPSDPRIVVLGVGYVGLPLAVAFGRRFDTIGYDPNKRRIAELRSGRDGTDEVTGSELTASRNLRFSSDPRDLSDRNIHIVTVPTPVDMARRPDLSALIAASKLIGGHLKPGSVVIYESTVYPGCTEEICVPVLEKRSGLKFNRDFVCGYSPERANPGDPLHRLETIIKVTSGSNPEAARYVDDLYRTIVPSGTHLASSIKVAEAAKIIENTQRDINIALINEFAMILNRLDIDTAEVLAAAETKWNFLPFRPGLVGGHCIGVDPYYLTYKAQEIGYHPQIILAGRRVNDGMGAYISTRILQLMVRAGINPIGARALVLGLAFKENCHDVRNSKVVDIASELVRLGMSVDIHDPWVDADEARKEYGLSVVPVIDPGTYDLVILAVPHAEFVKLGADGLRLLGKAGAVFFDVKSVFSKESSEGRL